MTFVVMLISPTALILPLRRDTAPYCSLIFAHFISNNFSGRQLCAVRKLQIFIGQKLSGTHMKIKLLLSYKELLVAMGG